MKHLFILTLSLSVANASTEPSLRPLLTQPDKVLLQADFSKPAKRADKSHWKPQQATRWSIDGGVLRGIPSTPENQAKKDHHKGLEPRMAVPPTPRVYAATFSVRFLDGKETPVAPFVEFGHHICRIRFSSKEGLSMLADFETTKVAAAPDFKHQPGKWYKMFVELKGTECVVQIADGPTLYAQHPVFTDTAPSGQPGIGFAGPRGGMLEIDDFTLWSIQGTPNPSWPKARKQFPSFKPIQLKEKKPDQIEKQKQARELQKQGK